MENELLFIDSMIDHYQLRTPDELKARLAAISPTIQILSRAWDKPNLTGEMILSFQILDQAFESHVVKIAAYPDNNELRQFIHNFCTNLCAEKQLLEGLILQKEAVL